MALLPIIRRLIGLGPYRWPAGEPALLANGTRWGTRLPDGTVILAHGFRIDRLICSRCQQPIEAEGDQAKADRIKQEA